MCVCHSGCVFFEGDVGKGGETNGVTCWQDAGRWRVSIPPLPRLEGGSKGKGRNFRPIRHGLLGYHVKYGSPLVCTGVEYVCALSRCCTRACIEIETHTALLR